MQWFAVVLIMGCYYSRKSQKNKQLDGKKNKSCPRFILQYIVSGNTAGVITYRVLVCQRPRNKRDLLCSRIIDYIDCGLLRA